MPNTSLFAVTTATAIVGLFLVWARYLAARKRKQQAVLTSAVVFWAYALVLTSLIPITLYQSPLVLVTPVILAAPYVSHHRFKVIIAVTVAVAIAVAVAGSQLPGLGIQERGHDWLVDLVIIGLRLVGTALLLFMAWQSHVSLSTKAVALRESRARLVSATDRERRRIERNLHDGTQQRLVAATMQLRVAQRLLSRRPEQVSPLISQLAGDLQEAGAELRDLAHWIYPPELAEHGLESALRTAASRSPLPTTVKAEGIGRYPSEVEVNVYFCCLEALQNAIKHAGEQATVTISLQNRAGLSCEVRDNGQGCEPAALQAGHGFINMSDRVGAIGGSLNVQSQPGAGVHVQCHIGLPG